ncbi:beta-N-acetylhexosaminidase [Vineibacter terrae]|uniref:beta-N-acetylhexosaminidase n=1 Tax=Vineibacter terrae TaxID=2586908 RepID=A0A5C8PIG0_9HYPH|nr:beta-N-acetylhexosaminidase [Vineibacter terrae]TXL73606.1 beta-N-acetylhexosaminidase [Vineibacter terrae]
MTMPAAVILGCAGPRLSADERAFFRDADPLGFILFARNVATPQQVRALTGDLRDCVGRAEAPVLIDQEGGRVARLKPPYWRVAPPAALFGALHGREPEAAVEATRLNARLIAADLAPLGIDVDCAPVLDVTVAGAHGVIGDRAFGEAPAVVAALGRAQAEGLMAGGVIPVMKHIPGHGRARADSHFELPIVEAGRAELEACDFAPFRALADLPWAMTAHVLYRALSGNQPATTSSAVVRDIIRGHIGFDGLLITDDLSMQALDGTHAERVRAGLAAGCDVALHCNGDMDQMREIAGVVPALTPLAWERVERGTSQRAAARDGADAEALERTRRRLAMLLDRPVA